MRQKYGRETNIKMRESNLLRVTFPLGVDTLSVVATELCRPVAHGGGTIQLVRTISAVLNQTNN
jgi:hypothetical protein